MSAPIADEILVWVHVPEADALPWEDAVKLAHERDERAAAALKADVEPLHLAEAAQAAQAEFLNDQAARLNADLARIGQRLNGNGDLRVIQTENELKILRELGY